MRILLIVLVCSLAGVSGQDQSLSAMADAERAFARAAAERGIRAAFLEFLDDEAIGFQPTLGNAKEGYRASPEPANPLATKLVWEPRTGAVATSGDLGWLTGPYTLIPGGDLTRARYGCYFSVWRRAAGGPWRVMLDVGITTAGACVFAGDGFVPMPEPTARFAGPGTSGRQSLGAADTQVAASARIDGAATALGRALHPHVRLHRDGQQPVLGRDTAVAWLQSNAAGRVFTPLEAVAASTADLGYAYGQYSRDAETGHYLRVWHRAAGGAWTVVADIESARR